MYLAGDIGGTKTHLALHEENGEPKVFLREKKFPSQEYENLSLIVREFLRGEKIERACFGIAGAVREGKSQATNLPWLVDSELLSQEFGIERVSIINDLEANAYGIQVLSEDEFFTLNKGDFGEGGNRALISPGTGLGEAGIYFDGKLYHPFACEGGHTDFAPRDAQEDELLLYLRGKFDHVSYERILSGPGLYNLYQFIIDTKKERERGDTLKEIKEGDSPRLISEKGVSGESVACMHALELFVSIYGAEAGNTALKMLALGGVYLGGGMTPKILEAIKKGDFLKSFKAKGRFSTLLSSIPIRVVLNDYTALFGAMFYAREVMAREVM